jgi:Protein of unknown function (DUF2630)
MDDKTVLQHIDELSKEELELEESRASESLSNDRQARLRSIEVELDQCWDLLRQRRARRHAGQDPDEAAVRSESVVEKYLQ